MQAWNVSALVHTSYKASANSSSKPVAGSAYRTALSRFKTPRKRGDRGKYSPFFGPFKAAYCGGLVLVSAAASAPLCPQGTMLDVAIIGAGPVGLATAAAILERLDSDTKVQVFDHVPAMIQCGAGLGLYYNGLAALEAISPELFKRVCTVGSSFEATVLHMPNGETMRQPVSSKQDTVASSPMFGWSELRDALAKWLPPGCLQLSKRFTKLEQHDDHVVVHFADGSSIATRMLVGADGIFSKVRQQSLADGPPDFTGTVLFRARLPLKEGLGLPDKESHMFTRDGLIALYYPVSHTHCVWTVGTPEASLQKPNIPAKPVKASNDSTSEGTAQDLIEQQAADGKIILERCKQVWGDKGDVIAKAINATDPATALEHNLYVRHPNSLDGGHWGVGRVTIVGDAAHPVRPTGQGLNQGMEDAVELAFFLSQGGLLPDSLRKFEASRIPRVQEVMACEMLGGMKSYGMTDEVKQKAQTLLGYSWAKAIWENKDTNAKKAYDEWVHHRAFPQA